jgi:hypothetical protein
VWALPDLSLSGGLTVAAPPDPIGGYDSYSGAGTLHYNALGFRATFGAGSGLWGGVGLVPAQGTDSDLRMHDPVSGIRDGLGVSLRSSSWGPSETDFCIVRHDGPRTIDASVVRGDEGSGAGLDIAATGSTGLATVPFATGDQILSTNEALRLHPVVLGAGVFRIRLTNVLGSIDWGLSLHDDSLAVQGRSDAVDQVFAAGAGAGEELVLTVSATDTFAVAVWKRGSADRGQFGVYRLQVDQVVVDAPLAGIPVATRLHAASPAPFRDRTMLSFDLATAGDSRLEVFDLRGARVRTLVAGRRSAGRHSVTWNGDDDHGRRLPAGVYLVRLEAETAHGHRKLVKVE